MAVNSIMPHASSLEMVSRNQARAAEKARETAPQKAEENSEENDVNNDIAPTDPKRFDRYEKGDEHPASKDPGADPAGEDTKCTANTDKVDAEIRALKNKKREIQQQIQSEDDEDKQEKLEQQLKSVEIELKAKDNDGYRKQHATFTYS